MKIKAIISLILSFIMLLGLTACNKSELSIDGDDTYVYDGGSSSSEITDTQESDIKDIFEFNEGELFSSDQLDWEESQSQDTHIFYIKNSSGVEIKRIAYRPSEYDVFKTLATHEIESNLDFVKIPNDTINEFELFDFIIVTEDGITTELTDITVLNKRGLEINYLHNNYGFEYLK